MKTEYATGEALATVSGVGPPTRSQLLTLLLTAKLADVLTTMRGLRGGLSETNPFAAAGIEMLGAGPFLFLFSLVSIAIVLLATELPLYVVKWTRSTVRWVRLVGYGIPTLIWSGAATYNLLLVVLHL
jgi:hypothetical protein